MKWEPQEDELLRNHYGKRPAKELAAELSRSVDSVLTRVRVLGVKARPLWTEEEDNFLLDYWGDKTVRGIAAILKRPIQGVCHRARVLGLKALADGYVSLPAALKQLGAGRHLARKAADNAGVKILRAMSRYGRSRGEVVEFAALEAAIKSYRSLKLVPTVKDHAARLGVDHNALRRTLVVASKYFSMPQRPPRGRWRIERAIVDAAVTWRARLRPALHWAREYQIGTRRLRSGLLAAGIYGRRLDRSVEFTREEILKGIEHATRGQRAKRGQKCS